jgi:hypothetical protein
MDEKELEELAELEREAMEERDLETDDIAEEDTESKDEESEQTETEDVVEEEESTDEKEEPEVKPEFTPIEIEVGGHKVKITSQEDLMAYVTKGAESFSKKEDKFVNEKTILEQGQLTADDLKLLVDAKNGSKEAIAKLAEIGKVDVFDLDSEMASQYKGQFEPYIESDVDKVANEILADVEHATTFRNISNNLPRDFMNAVSSNAEALKNFSGHIKSGLAQEVIPMAITAQMRYGGSFMDHYVDIGQKVSAGKTAKEEAKPTRSMSAEEISMRQRASAKTGSHVETKKDNSAEDIWNLSDAEFAEKYGS